MLKELVRLPWMNRSFDLSEILRWRHPRCHESVPQRAQPTLEVKDRPDPSVNSLSGADYSRSLETHGE